MLTKKKYKSLTIQAGVVIVLLQGMPEIVAAIDAAIPSVALATNPVVLKVLSAVAGVVAIYGRLRANTKIV